MLTDLIHTSILDYKGTCKVCRTPVPAWGGHDMNCPYEILEFVGNNVCHAYENHYHLCIPCLDYGTLVSKIDDNQAKISSITWQTHDKYHTEFCRQYRALFETPSYTEEAPTIKKAPAEEEIDGLY